ncbi:MAG: iron-containing redox enzyme family protein [Mycobacteriales bacterium]
MTPTDAPGSAEQLARALRAGGAALELLRSAEPVDRRDRFRTLLRVYDLHTAPLDVVGEAVRHQHAPAVAELKNRLEAEWLDELEQAWQQAGPLTDCRTPAEVVQAMRAVAAKDRLPAAYKWLATTATWEQVVDFLALEGGPDGGFDDLIALCQVGLSGTAKLELAKNFWDEMGQGELAGVHTQLHADLVAAIDMPSVPREELPVAALERIALNGLMATNRWLQPEMIGALGLLELQAGPRCRLVLQAFDRLGAPQGGYPFYVEHAEVDPVHGRDWMDKAIEPLAAERPEWGPRMVKGAWWRSTINLAFFAGLQERLLEESTAA